MKLKEHPVIYVPVNGISECLATTIQGIRITGLNSQHNKIVLSKEEFIRHIKNAWNAGHETPAHARRYDGTYIESLFK